jgi:branched-chain amino acid transport system ATP-binding protein
MSARVLSVREARKAFGGLVAVDDISFDVSRGELLGLIGPNGSGKTTVLNLISGALRPSAGQIILYGEEISRMAPHKIARTGVARTFQLVRILPGMTALENVMAGAVFGHARSWGEPARELAEKLLIRVGLGGRGAMPPSAMTYIDQKRLELARALASEPRLLLLDEFLAGLNPSELKAGISLLQDLRAEGRTMILVEHVMDAIRSLCDRCIVMSSGAKIAEGSVTTVLSDPEVIRAYLGDADA